MKDASHLNVQEKSSGDTPLIAACRRGNVSLVEYLLENGADVNLTNQVQKTADVTRCELWSGCHTVCVCVSETEDMSPLRVQEEILTARLPDDFHPDAHPAAWLLPDGMTE